jgi:hypothetical protein
MSAGRILRHFGIGMNVEIRDMCFANPSPEGRGWPEGPGEGCKDSSLYPSPAASRHPLPSGEGFA